MGQGSRYSDKINGLGTRGGSVFFKKEIDAMIEKDPILQNLIRDGAKVNVKDVVFTAKDKSGQIVWLEKGNKNAGLVHIQKHTDDFVKKHNIKSEHLTNHLKNVVKKGKVIKVTKKVLDNGKVGLEKIYLYKNRYYTVGAIGTNGYIVSMYPITGGK